ncbi:hypothetical protein FGG08_006536 [Glutinoglossum americanum]|uniref:Uncharacterized protein n=1 Tax=Glutinoglossum americanum TaxID=1670608 RepID=A0A9P8HW43_9PEZI|nr:hypothetical protein FGG08_006536 [Glutinoglossum americanum]
MERLRRLARRVKNKILRRDYYYIDDLPATLERSLKLAAPNIQDTYLSQVRGAASSLTGVILHTVESVFLPHFVVPAVFNFVFLGHYSIQIHTTRKWAKLNKVRLAKRCEVISSIIHGIIIKLCISALTLNHGDFALIAEAFLQAKNGLGSANKLIAVLDQVQARWADSKVISGLNVGLGAPLNAAENSIGLGGKTVTWKENLSAAQITELGFANQAGDSMAQAAFEQPADKAAEVGGRRGRRDRYPDYGIYSADQSSPHDYADPSDNGKRNSNPSCPPGYGGNSGNNSNPEIEIQSNARSGDDDTSLKLDPPTSYSTTSSHKHRKPRREAKAASSGKAPISRAAVVGAVVSTVIAGAWYFLS